MVLIQKLRLQYGWSQEQLAELSGLSVRTIQRIERGQMASIETLKSLGAVFDVDFATLKESEMTTATSPTANNDELLAFWHVRKIKGFYVHLAQYLLSSAVFLAINVLWWDPRHLWSLWIIFGWGSGILIHGLKAFDRIPFLTADWEKRQVERYLGRKL